MGERLGAIAAEAEEAGFASLWVMDHVLQIPFIGREWLEMLESYTTLGFLGVGLVLAPVWLLLSRRNAIAAATAS